MIKLGDTVTDRITGFSGIVSGIVDYISGCNQALVNPKLRKDGKFEEGRWFDLQRLGVHKDAKRIVLDNSKTPGADMSPPTR